MRFGQKFESPLNKVILAFLAGGLQISDSFDDAVLDEIHASIGGQVEKAYIKRMMLGLRPASSDLLSSLREIIVRYSGRGDIPNIGDVFVDDLRRYLSISRSDFSYHSGAQIYSLYFENMKSMRTASYAAYYTICVPRRENHQEIMRGLFRIFDDQVDENVLRCEVRVADEIWKGFVIGDNLTVNIIVESLQTGEILQNYCKAKTQKTEPLRGLVLCHYDGNILQRPVSFNFLGASRDSLRSIPSLSNPDKLIDFKEVRTDEEVAALIKESAHICDITCNNEFPEDWNFFKVSPPPRCQNEGERTI